MMRCAIAVALLFLAFSALSAAPQALPQPAKGVAFAINDDGVRMRAGPGTSAAILRKLSRGSVVVPLQASDLRERIGEANAYWYKCVLAGDGSAEGWIYGAYLSCRLAAAQPILFGLGMSLDETKGAAPAYCFSIAKGAFTAKAGFADLASFLGDRTIPIYDNPEGGGRLVGRLGMDSSGHWFYDLEPGRAPWKAGEPFALGRDRGAYAAQASFGPVGESEGKKALALARSYVESLWRDAAAAESRSEGGCAEELKACAPAPGGATTYFYSYLGVRGGRTMRLGCFLVLRRDGSWIRSNARLAMSEGDYRETELHGERGIVGAFGPVDILEFEGLEAGLIRFGESSGWEGTRYSIYVSNGYVVYDLGEYHEEL